jgi:hypothetical protein
MSDVPPPPSDPPPPPTAPADSPGARDPAADVAPADAHRPAEAAAADSANGDVLRAPGAVNPDAGAEAADAQKAEAEKAIEAEKAEAHKAIDADEAEAEKAIEAREAEAERRDGARKGADEGTEPSPRENGHKPPDHHNPTEATAEHSGDTAEINETADKLIAEAEHVDVSELLGDLADIAPDLLEHVTHAPMGPIPGVKEGVSWATNPAVWQMAGVYANVYAGRLTTGINDVRTRIFPKK